MKKPRCECKQPDPEEVADFPGVIVCTKCQGWFALRLHSVADLDKFQRLYDVRHDNHRSQ